jgi:hypothetical protein
MSNGDSSTERGSCKTNGITTEGNESRRNAGDLAIRVLPSHLVAEDGPALFRLSLQVKHAQRLKKCQKDLLTRHPIESSEILHKLFGQVRKQKKAARIN